AADARAVARPHGSRLAVRAGLLYAAPGPHSDGDGRWIGAEDGQAWQGDARDDGEDDADPEAAPPRPRGDKADARSGWRGPGRAPRAGRARRPTEASSPPPRRRRGRDPPLRSGPPNSAPWPA